ncbi:MAG: alpha/beta hydrolase [Clostridia bacterium]|nr:alpha/beta hydrolase [Clostridia bacterium]
MTVTINGMDVNYLHLGEGEAVVMLHGWGANAQLFNAIAEVVAQKYSVYALDFPGFGGTPEPPAVWTVDDYTDFTVQFIEKMGLKKVILLGHSFGGRVIIKLANRKGLSFEIDKIILTDAAGIKPEKSASQGTKEKVMHLGKKLLTPFPGLTAKLQSMTGSDDYRAASPLMRQILVNVVNEDLTDLLPGVRPSTLLIWGDLDTATPLADGQKMEQLMPDAGLAVIHGAGHYAFLDNPVLFANILRSFLNIA